MYFNRISSICIAIILLIVGIMIPLSIALYLSWIQATDIEREKLFMNAKRTIQRSRICLNEVYQTLDELEELKITPCTSEYAQKIRDMVFNKRCINEIQYINQGLVKCSSAGDITNKNHFIAEGFVLPNDTVISSNTKNFIKQGDHFISFTRGNYSIAVDKNPLTDVIVEPYIKIAIATEDGKIFSTLNYPSADLEDNLTVVYKTPGLYYIVSESLDYVYIQWRKSLILFLPFALIMSLIAAGAIIWVLISRLSDLGDLKLAVVRREFIVHYQPIIDLKTGICMGAEALVRWQKSDGTMVRPDLFIPLAENNGLIQNITDQIIDAIIRDLKTVLLADRNLHISINVSVLDFNSQRIFKKLDTVLAGTGIATSQIWLEITERGLIDFNTARDSLIYAQKLGYVIVIDDFGTGYSSLSYLKELPVNVLKIDKSFISTVDTDSVTSNVTQYIINIAKELNLKIVAEGVETVSQSDYLKVREVDFAQGWLYAKAMPLDEFLNFCKVKK